MAGKRASAQKLGAEFISYLKNEGVYRKTWKREDLATHYRSFRALNCWAFRFSKFLHESARCRPRMLRIRRSRVVFSDNLPPPTHYDSNFATPARRPEDNGASLSSNSTSRPRNHNGQLLEKTHRSTKPKDSLKGGVGFLVPDTRLPIGRAEGESDIIAGAGEEQVLKKEPTLSSGAVVNFKSKLLPRSVSSSIEVKTGRGSKVKLQISKSEAADETLSSSKLPEILLEPRAQGGNNVGSGVSSKKSGKNIVRRRISGVRPKFLSNGNEEELKKYFVPESVRKAYKNSRATNVPLPEFSKPLTAVNYAEKFHVLFYIEELQYQRDVEMYAINSSTMNQGRALLYLDVPGLAEKRPSLLVGDKVFVVKLDPEGNEYGDEYEGFVHDVKKLQVGLGFNKKLLKVFQKKMKFNVRFGFNRRPLRIMHRALDLLSTNVMEMLFPTSAPPECKPKGIIMRNRNIEKNVQQKTAVENIVLGKTSPIYIIFGPPGTGKTVTMVEAIAQTIKHYNFNILVCALSNFACDLLAERLIGLVDKNKMLRLYAASRSWNDVSQKIKDSCTTNHESYVGFMMPDLKDLLPFRIIVCTFVTASRLVSAELPPGHFQRVFVDESGQAFEPECLVAISGIMAETGKVILAGDPKQLGPIVRSQMAARNGLQLSLLERLMETCPIYQKDPVTEEYNPQCITKLVENYRSHESILNVPNKKFYANELQVCADEIMRSRYCGWEELPNKQFPIIFHGVQGSQARENNSPSYFNQDEVKVVSSYVKKLLDTRGRYKLPTARDIGIVTPYKKQVEKIRRAIKTPDIDVGSVEVFQGQERLVIIISTVRSSQEGLTDDAKFHLGFLCDPKRFNVSLTRAKALIIVVGNPRILCLDKYWKSLIKYCLKNNAYRGAKFSADDFKGAKDMEEIENLFQTMRISSADEDPGDEDQPSAIWRKEH